MTIDFLAIVAHPDDAELTCAGLLMQAKAAGSTTGVVDLTRGEMSSNGTPEQRDSEAAEASAIMNLDLRLNLGWADGHIAYSEENIIKIVEVIREYKPRMIIAPYWEDHHPDHANTSKLVKDAWWFSGIKKYPAKGEAHRAENVLYYLARYAFTPSLVLDVTEHWPKKREAVACYRSQLHVKKEGEKAGSAKTFIADPSFLDMWEGRHAHFGSLIGAKYGEAYLMRTPVAITNPGDLLGGRPGII